MRPLDAPAAATDLAADQFLHWPSGPAGRLCVHDGTVWLTVDGEADDHVLERGQCIDLPPRRHALADDADRLPAPHHLHPGDLPGPARVAGHELIPLRVLA